MTINLEDLDRCIRAMEEARAGPIVRIYLNPDYWREAKTSLEILTGKSEHIPADSVFGIPVILSSALGRGQYVMEYETLTGTQLVGWSVK